MPEMKISPGQAGTFDSKGNIVPLDEAAIDVTGPKSSHGEQYSMREALEEGAVHEKVASVRMNSDRSIKIKTRKMEEWQKNIFQSNESDHLIGFYTMNWSADPQLYVEAFAFILSSGILRMDAEGRSALICGESHIHWRDKMRRYLDTLVQAQINYIGLLGDEDSKSTLLSALGGAYQGLCGVMGVDGEFRLT